MHARVLAIVLTLALVPLAGCFGDDPPVNEHTITASGGKLSNGWAYDGVGITNVDASLTGNFVNDANTGSAVASFPYMGSQWTITFDQFAGTKDFMDGGIAFALNEHGDTGIADTSIPRIHALVAGWGTATVTRDGTALIGKDGATAWNAHLMVSDTTVRGADGKITNEAGAAPYDPAKPADGKRIEGDRQVFLWVKSPDGETSARAPLAEKKNVAFSGPETTQSVDVPADPDAATVAIVVNTTVTQGVGAGQIEVALMDANGAPVGSPQTGTVSPQAQPAFTLEVPPGSIGPFKVQLKGTGAFGVTVDYSITYDDHPFIVLTWDDVTFS